MRQKRVEIENELEPRRPEKYRTLEKLKNKAKDVFSFLPSIQAQKDFEQIDKIVNEIIWYTKNNRPSETIIKNILEEVTIKIASNSKKISPVRLGVIYKIQELLYSISQKELSNLDKSELEQLNEDILNEIKSQRDILSIEFNKLLKERYAKQQELEEYSKNQREFKQKISELKAEILELQTKIRQYIQSDRTKQSKINKLNSNLNKLKKQKEYWTEKKNQLLQKLDQQNNRITQLEKKLEKYSQIRILEGKYIGNISNRNSKYHFNKRCNHWKMLVGEYVLKLDDSREISSSISSDIFVREGLGKCEVCADKNRNF